MSHIRHSNLTTYYAARAPEYDKIYDRPERQNDLRRLRELLCTLLGGRRVLELACGTGYWTQAIAEVARSVLALDANQELLKIAAARLRFFSNTALLIDDAFTLSTIADTFDAGLAAFWWSHVPKENIPAFLDTFHSKLHSGAMVIFTDNRFVEGSSTPICRTDEHGNSYQLRRLADGSEHDIVKNFPTAQELDAALRPRASHYALHELQYFWCVTYTLR
jgi:SAM-dependent methyltransferase